MIAFVLVMLAWLVFAAAFVLVRPLPSPPPNASGPPARAAPTAPSERRDPRSRVGIALQVLGYFLMWFSYQPPFPLLERAPQALSLVAMLTAVVLAYASAFLAVWARRALGREWSITARLLAGHRLVTEGPYALVRHPIYSAMLGLWIATALAGARPLGIALGIVPLVWGTLVRVRSEDALLRAAFGEEYNAWARRVPALVPGARGSTHPAS